MRHLLLLLILCGFTKELSAQIFGPVAVPVTDRKEARSNQSVLAFEASAGTNLVTRRKVLSDRFQTDGLELAVGWQVGIQLVFFPESNVGLLLGFEGVNDRGTLLGYAKSFNGNGFNQDGFEPDAHRTRIGDVSINENWLRSRLGLRFAIGKLLAETSYQVSSLLGGSQQYDYVQTTTGLFDPVTDRLITLEEPITRQGSRNLIDDTSGGYGGLFLALTYPVSERLSVGLNYEQGWHLSREAINQEWRQRRSRLGAGVTYQLGKVGRRN